MTDEKKPRGPLGARGDRKGITKNCNGAAVLGQMPTTDTNQLLNAALRYADLGYAVFPCVEGRKTPLTEHGFKDSTCDPDTIEEWWSKNPDANIGLATAGLLVVDVDGKDNEWPSQELTGGAMATTPRHGRHYYFRQPTGKAWRNTTSRLAVNVDTRADGGYVVAPPSKCGSNCYKWCETLELECGPSELPEPPEWLLELLDGDTKPIQAADETQADDPIPEGMRNDRLARTAGYLRRCGLDEKAILAAISQVNQDHCAPPLAPDEVAKIAASVSRYEPDQVTQAGVEGWAGKWLAPTNAPWPEIEPLGHFDPPAFPVDAMPEVFRVFCAHVSESLQVPTDMPAMLSLAAAATCFAKRIVVQPQPDWVEPVNLYLAVALESGERKSAVFRKVFKPIQDYEAFECKRLIGAVEARRNERAIAEKRLILSRTEAAKATDPDKIAKANKRVEDATWELLSKPALFPPQYTADDCTPERLVGLLQEQGGRMALLSPEGDLFGDMSGRYGKIAKLDVYLKGHSSDKIRTDRVNPDRPPEHVEDPALTIGLAVQPSVIAGLAAHDGFEGRGLLARFLYSLPTSRVGRRSVEAKAIPEAATSGYELLIAAAMKYGHPDDLAAEIPVDTLCLNSDAKGELTAFRAAVENDLRVGGRLGLIRSWGSKLPGAVCRIVGILHGLAHAHRGNPADHLIDAETMCSAIRIGEYLTEHALGAFSLMGADSDLVRARKLVGWIESKRLTEFSRRDAYNQCRSRNDTVDVVDEPLALLWSHGYIRTKNVEDDPKKPGRKPSPIFLVNPEKCAQNAQNCQDG